MDLEGYAALLHGPGHPQHSVIALGDYVEGKAANRALNANVIKWADPGKTRVLDRFVSEDGTFAVSTWEWIGTNYLGNPFDLPFAMVAEYRDDKISKQTIYYASPDARSQLLGG